MRKTLLVITTLLRSIAYAEPIKLAGITMEMSVEQQRQVLVDAGYVCTENELLPGLKIETCEKEGKQVNPSNKKVRINCQTFNACGLSYKELAQEIVNQGVVTNMEYEPRYAKSLDGQQFLIERFCGRGDEGDMLCVEADKNMLGQVLVTVTLEKGTLGQGQVKFD